MGYRSGCEYEELIFNFQDANKNPGKAGISDGGWK
jgi:hypothetical protein